MRWGTTDGVRRKLNESYLSYTHRLVKNGFSVDMIDRLWNQSLKDEALAMRGHSIREANVAGRYECPFERSVNSIRDTPAPIPKIKYAFRFFTGGISKD